MEILKYRKLIPAPYPVLHANQYLTFNIKYKMKNR
jgi:hypothetical protein